MTTTGIDLTLTQHLHCCIPEILEGREGAFCSDLYERRNMTIMYDQTRSKNADLVLPLLHHGNPWGVSLQRGEY